jgi:hypothetical protein
LLLVLLVLLVLLLLLVLVLALSVLLIAASMGQLVKIERKLNGSTILVIWRPSSSCDG